MSSSDDSLSDDIVMESCHQKCFNSSFTQFLINHGEQIWYMIQHCIKVFQIYSLIYTGPSFGLTITAFMDKLKPALEWANKFFSKIYDAVFDDGYLFSLAYLIVCSCLITICYFFLFLCLQYGPLAGLVIGISGALCIPFALEFALVIYGWDKWYIYLIFGIQVFGILMYFISIIFIAISVDSVAGKVFKYIGYVLGFPINFYFESIKLVAENHDIFNVCKDKVIIDDEIEDLSDINLNVTKMENIECIDEEEEYLQEQSESQEEVHHFYLTASTFVAFIFAIVYASLMTRNLYVGIALIVVGAVIIVILLITETVWYCLESTPITNSTIDKLRHLYFELLSLVMIPCMELFWEEIRNFTRTSISLLVYVILFSIIGVLLFYGMPLKLLKKKKKLLHPVVYRVFIESSPFIKSTVGDYRAGFYFFPILYFVVRFVFIALSVYDQYLAVSIITGLMTLVYFMRPQLSYVKNICDGAEFFITCFNNCLLVTNAADKNSDDLPGIIFGIGFIPVIFALVVLLIFERKGDDERIAEDVLANIEKMVEYQRKNPTESARLWKKYTEQEGFNYSDAGDTNGYYEKYCDIDKCITTFFEYTGKGDDGEVHYIQSIKCGVHWCNHYTMQDFEGHFKERMEKMVEEDNDLLKRYNTIVRTANLMIGIPCCIITIFLQYIDAIV